MGRIDNAENIIKKAFLILRPSRLDDPWGRDIIDACSAGVPIISSGKFNDIIIDNYNSFYVNDFEIKKVFSLIIKLINNKKKYIFLKKNLLKQSKNVLNTKKNINRFEKILHSVI